MVEGQQSSAFDASGNIVKYLAVVPYEFGGTWVESNDCDIAAKNKRRRIGHKEVELCWVDRTWERDPHDASDFWGIYEVGGFNRSSGPLWINWIDNVESHDFTVRDCVGMRTGQQERSGKSRCRPAMDGVFH